MSSTSAGASGPHEPTDRADRTGGSDGHRSVDPAESGVPAPDNSLDAQWDAVEEAADSPAEPAGGEAHGGGRALLSGTAWQALGQILPLIINLGLTPYFINGLSPQRYSVFLLINTITMLLSQFDGGLGQSSMRFFTIYAGRGDRVSATRLLYSVSAIFLVLTVVFFGVVVFGATAILNFFGISEDLRPEAHFLLSVLVILFAVLMLRNLFNSLLFSHGRFRITSMAIVSGHLIYLVGMILTIEKGWGLWGVAWTYIVQQLVGSLITVPVAVPYVTREGLRWMDRGEASEFFRYAWKIQITGLVTMLTTQKDQIVAGRMLTAQLSGPYGQGSNFAQQLRLLPLNAQSPLQSMIGRGVGGGGPEAAVGDAAQAQRMWVRAVTGWTAVGLPATYFGVHTWLPEAYSVASEVAAILFAGSYFSLLSIVLIIWCLALGHPELDLRQSLVGLAANLVLSIVLGMMFGIIGVVVATALGQLVAALWLSYDSRRVLGTPLPWFGAQIPVLPGLVALGVTFGLEYLLRGYVPHGTAGLLSCGLLAVPGMLLFLVMAFGVGQLRTFAARVPGLRRFA